MTPTTTATGNDEAGNDEAGSAIDRRLFGRIVAHAVADPARPPTEALGLARAEVARLLDRHLPEHAGLLDTVPAGAGPGADAPEETDLRRLLLDHRAGRGPEEEWLAAIVARRSLLSNHLWQDMGFADRDALNRMFRRHFPELVRRNDADMKWKKFLYRQLCEREGVLLCKSPNCAVCPDVAHCFGGEPGPALHHADEPADQPALPPPNDAVSSKI